MTGGRMIVCVRSIQANALNKGRQLLRYLAVDIRQRGHGGRKAK